MQIGIGYDIHRLVNGRALVLGGIQIDHPMGLLGHSDGDVVIHAVIDALLGAAGLRDIGFHFPDNAPQYKDIDSTILLEKTVELLHAKGYATGNIDTTVCLQRPKLKEYVPQMQEKMAGILKVQPDRVSVKATTSEGLGFTGREEGIAVYAVALVYTMDKP